jgi:hypothetical protein
MKIFMHLPDSEQGYKSPGWPFIVIASDEFGPPPFLRNSVKTSLTSLFHHSPIMHKLNKFLENKENKNFFY